MYQLNIKALKQFFPLLILCLGTFAISCGDDEGDDPPVSIDCTGSDPSYMNDIKPIIDASCALAGCHEANFLNGDFTTYDGLKEKANNGTLIERAVEDKDMPPENTNGPMELSDEEIKLINCWVADGAPNN